MKNRLRTTGVGKYTLSKTVPDYSNNFLLTMITCHLRFFPLLFPSCLLNPCMRLAEGKLYLKKYQPERSLFCFVFLLPDLHKNSNKLCAAAFYEYILWVWVSQEALVFVLSSILTVTTTRRKAFARKMSIFTFHAYPTGLHDEMRVTTPVTTAEKIEREQALQQ